MFQFLSSIFGLVSFWFGFVLFGFVSFGFVLVGFVSFGFVLVGFVLFGFVFVGFVSLGFVLVGFVSQTAVSHISSQNSVTCNGEYCRPVIKAQPSFHGVEVDGGYVIS